MQQKKFSWLALIFSLSLVLLVEYTASFFTMSSVDTWFKTLTKPAWQPPNWAFGPVWTFLYLSMGVAIWLVWEKQREKGPFNAAPYILYGLQLLVNFLWSYFFFYLHRPLLGLIDLTLLIGLVIATMISFWHYSKLAGALFIPYLIWIVYAWSLNAAIWWLN